MTDLVLGVPSKGRLMEKTFEWFGTRGIALARSGSEREYAGQVDGISGVSLVLLSARLSQPVSFSRTRSLPVTPR